MCIKKNFLYLQTQNLKEMKKDIHPDNYRVVVFKDMSNGEYFMDKSTVDTKDTIEVDGQGPVFARIR